MNAGWIFLKPKPAFPSYLSSLLFHFRPFSSVRGISLLLSASGKERNVRLGSSIRASLLKNPEFASQLFDEMPFKDTVSSNSIFSGFLNNGNFKMGFEYFKEMMGSVSFIFDHASVTTILSACNGLDFIMVNKMMHGLVLLSGLEREIAMAVRNVISWTAVISGLAQNEFCEESLDFFVKMEGAVVLPNYLTYLSALLACSGMKALREAHLMEVGFQSDLCIESALMDVFSKCGSVQDAWLMFESAEVLDTIAMAVMLVGDTSLALGKQVHSLIIKKGFISNSFVSNELINMYSKCGELEESVEIFNSTARRNSVSWNSIIAAHVLIREMRSDGVDPTDVTFISLLHGCSHVGLVNKGMEFFESMQCIYAAVVDLLGACSIHGDAKIGKYAADQWLLTSPDNPVPSGRWKERARTIMKMKEMGVAKEAGTNCIEIEKGVRSFIVADQMHPRAMIIYSTLLELFGHTRDEGYVPRFIVYYMDGDGKEFSAELQDNSELLCSMW
ncbi:unnamed protein product [Withania somnifera]